VRSASPSNPPPPFRGDSMHVESATVEKRHQSHVTWVRRGCEHMGDVHHAKAFHQYRLL